jgi:hypothetical protein
MLAPDDSSIFEESAASVVEIGPSCTIKIEVAEPLGDDSAWNPQKQ